MTTDPAPKKDFFISYNKADKAWAEWIVAWRSAGSTSMPGLAREMPNPAALPSPGWRWRPIAASGITQLVQDLGRS